MYSINRPAGSLARSQVCNLALHLWDKDSVPQKVIHEWLDRLVKRNGWLDIGRKRPRPHEAWFGIAAYFFYYGHFYAGESLKHLPAKQSQAMAARLAPLVLKKQEKNGSWWDFPLYDYGHTYGTAFGLMYLQDCRKHL